ncbi:MAG TPA: hypothetical protein VMV17_21515, partial [Streptosporangiaceae bacterium]|nr:hypothetical protein [Streptosporangiaceae bacterium]
MVREQQIGVAWVNYVHERFGLLPNSKASHRQRTLVLAMPMSGVVPREDLEGLTPKIAKLYASTGPRTLSRDLNRLEKLGLIRQSGDSYATRARIVQAFLPPMAAVES